MGAVESTVIPECVKSCALLKRANRNRKAAWFRVLAVECDLTGFQLAIDTVEVVFEDAPGILPENLRRKLEYQRAHRTECRETARVTLREAFASFRSLDAAIVAEGGLPAEVDPELEDEIGIAVRLLEVRNHAFPDTCRTL